MVCINTNYTKFQFKHFVSIPSSDCVIATAQDERSRIKLFLIINGNGPIYTRNGIKDTWDQLDSVTDHTVRKLVQDALGDKAIPHYSTDSLSVLN